MSGWKVESCSETRAQKAPREPGAEYEFEGFLQFYGERLLKISPFNEGLPQKLPSHESNYFLE